MRPTPKQRERTGPSKMRKFDLDRRVSRSRRKKNDLVLANDPGLVLVNVLKDLDHGAEAEVETGREKVGPDPEIVKDLVPEITRKRAKRREGVETGTRRRKLQETTTRRRLVTSREGRRKRSWSRSTWRSPTRLRSRAPASSYPGRIS